MPSVANSARHFDDIGGRLCESCYAYDLQLRYRNGVYLCETCECAIAKGKFVAPTPIVLTHEETTIATEAENLREKPSREREEGKQRRTSVPPLESKRRASTALSRETNDAASLRRALADEKKRAAKLRKSDGASSPAYLASARRVGELLDSIASLKASGASEAATIPSRSDSRSATAKRLKPATRRS